MSAHDETPVFHVRATDPSNNEQVAYECVGYPTALAKAAELRMAAYKDVVMSLAEASDSPHPRRSGDYSSRRLRIA
jgi:hypothetical protein